VSRDDVKGSSTSRSKNETPSLFGALEEPAGRPRGVAAPPAPVVRKTPHLLARSIVPSLPLFDRPAPDGRDPRGAGDGREPVAAGRSRGKDSGSANPPGRARGEAPRHPEPAPAGGAKRSGRTSPDKPSRGQTPRGGTERGRARRGEPVAGGPHGGRSEETIDTGLATAPAPEPEGAAGRKGGARETAVTLAAKQREISISEFFTKNRHLLGFDNPQKALLTAVKEAVDNALDACEEAGILPSLEVSIAELAEERFRIRVADNGPGIVRQQIPRIFGKLLYGSKFHRFRQSRGQQGIGISAAGMYGQLTTGKPVAITSKIGKGKPSHYFEIQIDTRKNQPEVVKDEVVPWETDHGTAVEIELEGTYKKGRRSVDDYIEQTALANPHATIEYRPPKDEPIRYERVAREMPREALEIKPHPHGVELGALMQMLKETKARNLRSALQHDFSRVSGRVADEILKGAGIESSRAPHKMLPQETERLHRAIQKTRIMAPPTNCLSPIGEELIFKGLKARVEADFITSSTRPPAVYRGAPFQVEVGLAYGGKLPAEDLIEVYRFANRVPLQYQQSACAITKAVITTDWRNYGLSQSKGAPPAGPMILFVHVASVWVPFTSESKEAVAHYPEIIKELRLALQECGRRLGAHLRHHRRVQDELKKRSYIEKYLPAIGEALQEILSLSDRQRDATVANLKDVLEKSRRM
jgi:DNA topoisomerase-6 subunit B